MAKKEEVSLESLHSKTGDINVNALIDSIYVMMGEENYKNVGEYFTDLHHDYSIEMARVGYIENPKYAIDVYSRELQHEEPHISVIQISKTSDLPVAKIALPRIDVFNQNPDMELIVLWQRTPNTVNSKMKKTVKTWFKEKHKSGLTNLQFAWELWDAQAEQYKGHVSGRQGAKKSINKK